MDRVLNMVLEAVKEIGEDQNNQILLNADEDTRLFGENLDSMGIVFLVTELEDKILDELGLSLTLADERAMSQKTSPFRSVKILSRYVGKLIQEQESK